MHIRCSDSSIHALLPSALPTKHLLGRLQNQQVGAYRHNLLPPYKSFRSCVEPPDTAQMIWHVCGAKWAYAGDSAWLNKWDLGQHTHFRLLFDRSMIKIWSYPADACWHLLMSGACLGCNQSCRLLILLTYNLMLGICCLQPSRECLAALQLHQIISTPGSQLWLPYSQDKFWLFWPICCGHVWVWPVDFLTLLITCSTEADQVTSECRVFLLGGPGGSPQLCNNLTVALVYSWD